MFFDFVIIALFFLLVSLPVIPLVFVYGFDTKNVYSILRNIVISLSIALLIPFTTHIGYITFLPTIRDLYVTSIVGFLSIFAGVFLPIAFLSVGYILGGILTIIMSVSWNWYRFTDPMRFGMLIAALLLVIALGYWFFWRGKLKK